MEILKLSYMDFCEKLERANQAVKADGYSQDLVSAKCFANGECWVNEARLDSSFDEEHIHLTCNEMWPHLLWMRTKKP